MCLLDVLERIIATRLIVLAGLSAVLVFMLSSCSLGQSEKPADGSVVDREGPTTSAHPSVPPKRAANQERCQELSESPTRGKKRIELWFANANSHYVRFPKPLVVHRDFPSGDVIAKAAVEAWIAGPTRTERAAGARSIVNTNTEILSLEIQGGIASIDVNYAFHKTGLGTCCEDVVLRSLVGVLTQFSTVERVVLFTEGERNKFWGGHGGILDPQGEARPRRDDYRIARRCS